MTFDVAKLRQLHRPYQPVPPYGELYCQGCYLDWPCATSELLDAYDDLLAAAEAVLNDAYMISPTNGDRVCAHCDAYLDPDPRLYEVHHAGCPIQSLAAAIKKTKEHQ